MGSGLMYQAFARTESVCPECLRTIAADKAVGDDGYIYMIKTCPEHGSFETLIWEDGIVDYLKWNTAPGGGNAPDSTVPVKDGCPRDCGLCEEHESAGCCVLLELTKRCSLRCPVCFASAGEGSGVIFSEDGYIVTNQHVVDGATSLKVVTSDGTSYEAQLVGEDTQTDLAVIKIDATGLTAAEFADSADLQVGDEVMAVGNPGGLQLSSSVTFGYVSALNRPVTNSDTGYTINCIQTDAAINPGNSGGALVDMNGRVVGINSSKIAATEYEGLGFAIPSDRVQPIVSDLMKYGYVQDRPMLGITGQYLNALQAAWNNVPSGFLVGEVNSEEATRSGLQANDIITAIGDTQVTSAGTIATYIADMKPGDTVTLTVYRSSSQSNAEVELVLSENTGSSVSSSSN